MLLSTPHLYVPQREQDRREEVGCSTETEDDRLKCESVNKCPYSIQCVSLSHEKKESISGLAVAFTVLSNK